MLGPGITEKGVNAMDNYLAVIFIPKNGNPKKWRCRPCKCWGKYQNLRIAERRERSGQIAFGAGSIRVVVIK